MNKKYTLGIIPLLLLAFMAQMTSCSPEHFVDATQLAIINYDTIPLTIYVDGEEATSFDSFWGEVHLNSGSYEIVAKSRGEEIDKINVTIPKPSDPDWDLHFFSVGGKISYALCDMKFMYFDGESIELEETYWDQSYIHVEASNRYTYYPWNTLPASLYAYEGSTVDINRLYILPSSYQDKSEEVILGWCAKQVLDGGF